MGVVETVANASCKVRPDRHTAALAQGVPPMSPCKALRNFAPGCAAALDLDARFRAPLMAFFLRRLRDHALAQDLTQETLLRLFVARQMTAIENLESYI